MNSLLSDFDLSNPIAGVAPDARVGATEAALDLLGDIRAIHGAVSFHHSGGCADGTKVMCLPKDELELGDGDLFIGRIDGASVYVSAHYADVWCERQLVLDAVQGHGGMFSLDSGKGRRFFVRSRRLSRAERRALGLGTE